MKNLKNFTKFVKENNDDEKLSHYNNIRNDNENMMDFENLPSELWTDEMIDAYSKYENKINNDNIDIDRLDHYIEDDIDDFDDPNDMLINNIDNELTEKYSELETYELKNVFDEEEKENDD